MHDGPFEAHARVAPVLRVLAVAEPLVGDAVAERVADAAVDHEQLAVRAMIEPAEVPPVRLAVGRSFAPLRFNRSSSGSLAFEAPRQSMSTRTLTPARARSLSASTNCVSSLPADQTNVSRCTLCFAAAMSASMAGKIAPFCSTAALLPSWTELSVRPAISGSASLISGYSSGSSSRYGVPRARVSKKISAHTNAVATEEITIHATVDIAGYRESHECAQASAPKMRCNKRASADV